MISELISHHLVMTLSIWEELEIQDLCGYIVPCVFWFFLTLCLDFWRWLTERHRYSKNKWQNGFVFYSTKHELNLSWLPWYPTRAIGRKIPLISPILQQSISCQWWTNQDPLQSWRYMNKKSFHWRFWWLYDVTLDLLLPPFF